jgi:hypothetical protein
MTLAVFESEMSRLSGLKFAPATMQTHWEALRNLPVELLQAAVTKAQDECSEFPSPKMLKIFADQVRPRVIPIPQEPDWSTPLPTPKQIVVPKVGTIIPVTREWSYYCDECSDMGMRSYWCDDAPSPRYPWLQLARCGRRGGPEAAHYAHEWADKCPCAATNPAVLRRRERQIQSGKRGEKE